ncbi:MAG: alpha/beta hydrolase [Halanaerobiales bacterium]
MRRSIMGCQKQEFEEFDFNCRDGTQLHVYKWESKLSATRGAVLIVHGMAEHAGRYDEFASHLTEAGYTVFAHDQRGHGKTAEKFGEFGFIAPDNGWQKLVKDIESLMDFIDDETSCNSLFLFGHSMGSLLVRNVMTRGKELNGVILSGTMRHPGLKLVLARILARFIAFLRGKKFRSHLLHYLTLGSYDIEIKYDWLTRESTEVEKYSDDPACGFLFTAEFYCNLFRGLEKIYSPEVLDNIAEDLPVFIISGAYDPVGEEGKGVLAVFQQMVELGLKDIKYKLYPGARHELLHETNKEVVIDDVLEWLKKRDDYNE